MTEEAWGIECQYSCDNPEVYLLEHTDKWGEPRSKYMCNGCKTPFLMYDVTYIDIIDEDEEPEEYNRLLKILENDLKKKKENKDDTSTN